MSFDDDATREFTGNEGQVIRVLAIYLCSVSSFQLNVVRAGAIFVLSALVDSFFRTASAVELSQKEKGGGEFISVSSKIRKRKWGCKGEGKAMLTGD
jgi:hypothetical protein